MNAIAWPEDLPETKPLSRLIQQGRFGYTLGMERRPRSLFLLLLLSIPTWGEVQFGVPFGVILSPPSGGTTAPTLRDDEKEMFLESSGDIYRAYRDNPAALFLNATRVNELSTTTSIEERPFLSTDGLRIYFTRRPGSSSVREIYCATRETLATTFGLAAPQGPQGKTPFTGQLGSLTGDEKKAFLEVILTVPPGSGTPLTQQSDIAFATRETTAGKFGPWTFINEVNTLDYERDPFISRDDHTLAFVRVGPLSHLPGTIFFTTRSSSVGSFPPAEAASGVNDVNTASEDPFLIFPGSRLYFRRSSSLLAANRIFNANYSLPQVEAQAGRSFFYPVQASTTEKDATQFSFKLFYDALYLKWLGIAFPADAPGEVLSVQPASGSTYTIQLDTPIPGDGELHTILYVQFLAASNAPAGLLRNTQMTQAKVNAIVVSSPPAGRVQFLAGPGYAGTSLFRLR
jgi:hypothetical protein